MQGKLSYSAQSNLFKIELSDIVSDKINLVLLTKKIDWNEVEIYYGPFYSLQCRPSVPKRTMVGLLLLKSMFSVADEVLILKVKDLLVSNIRKLKQKKSR